MFTVTRIGKWTGRRILAPIMCLALAYSSVAMAVEPSTGGEGAAYVENHGEIYFVDFSEELAGFEAVVSGVGSYQVRTLRADFGSGTRSSGLTLGANPEDDLQEVGSTALEVKANTGLDPKSATSWDDVLTIDVSSTVDDITVTYAAGADTMSLTLPKTALSGAKLTSADTVTVAVNGVQADIPGNLYSQLSLDPSQNSGVIDQMPPSFLDVTNSFLDPGSFSKITEGMLLVSVGSHPKPPTNTPAGCFGTCFACGGSLLLVGASVIGLIAACGAAVSTGGMAIALCVGAFMSQGGATMIAIGTCVNCVECVTCPCTGEPNCSCG